MAFWGPPFTGTDVHSELACLAALDQLASVVEFGKLQVEINDEKSRIVDLKRGESFGFLGFDFPTR